MVFLEISQDSLKGWFEMEEIYLVEPSMEYEKAYNEMLLDFHNTRERVHPGAIKLRGMDYTTWLKNLIINKSIKTYPPHFVPSDTYFLVNKNNKILGAISIRHYLNEELLKFGGHIGYGISPSERRKKYATEMLRMAIEYCKNLGMEKILVTCNKNNIASAKTIAANGGVIENELMEDNGNIVQRYWIKL